MDKIAISKVRKIETPSLCPKERNAGTGDSEGNTFCSYGKAMLWAEDVAKLE